MGSVITYYKYLLRRNLLSWRMLSVILITILISDAFFSPVRDYCENTNVKVSQWGFATMWDNKYVLLCYLLIFIYGIANIPQDRCKERYMIARMGVTKWLYGQILYIHTFAWLFVLFVLLIENLLLLPVLEWNDKWGSGWIGLTNFDIAFNHNVLVSTSQAVISNYTPLEAMIQVFLIMGLVLAMLGTLMLYFNFYSRVLGPLVASAIAFMGLAARKDSRLFRYSVVSWIQLDCHYTKMHTNYPTLAYIFTVLVLLSILFVVLAKIRINSTQENNRRRY